MKKCKICGSNHNLSSFKENYICKKCIGLIKKNTTYDFEPEYKGRFREEHQFPPSKNEKS